MNKKIIIIVGTIVFFFAVLAITFLFFSNQFTTSGVSDNSEPVIFDVLTGQSFTTVAQNLHQKQLVKNSWLFTQYARIKGAHTNIKRGEYELRQNMTPDEILNIITSGKSITRNFTVPEGFNIFDIAMLMEKSGYGSQQEFLNLVTNKDIVFGFLKENRPSLEGYLFPDTYKVTKFDTQKEIIEQMVKRFFEVWAEIEPMAQTLNWTRHQVVTFASIVEKETGSPEDRTIVASVFHNRLKINMRLQTDPTVLYGMAVLKGSMPNNITRADLQNPTPYNTYTNNGLPPTPISNPGKQAFLATISPKNSNYLYFVSRNDGTTVFSDNLAAHNEAVKKYQMDPKSREGKSWKDLNK